MSQPELTVEQREALNQNGGIVQGSSYVLISAEKYRELMGVETDKELAASLQAIDEAMEQLKSGQTIPLDEAKRRLDEKYGVHD